MIYSTDCHDEELRQRISADRENPWPLPNVWLGVSCEDQATADDRIPLLLQTPAAVRFVSCEPLLSGINLQPFFAHSIHCIKCHPGGSECRCPQLHWVIAGGESGPLARPMHPDWARSLRDQCQAASVPFFFKQWGEWVPRSAMPCAWTGEGSNPSHAWSDGAASYRIGKHAAGRTLDGREWDEMPSFGASRKAPNRPEDLLSKGESM